MPDYASQSGSQIEVLAPITSCCGMNRDVIATSMDADGDFVILYGDQYGNSLIAQRYGADGTAQGDSITVPGSTSYMCLGSNPEPYGDIAMSDDGAFVVAWGDGDDGNVYAQKYDSTGAADGSKLTVKARSGSEYLGSVNADMDADGDFAVSWRTSDYSSGTYAAYAQ